MENITKSEILLRVEKICQNVFGNPLLVVGEKTSSADVENWDSMTNLFLVDEIEKSFSIKFNLDEILEAQSIGDLCEIIKVKLEKDGEN